MRLIIAGPRDLYPDDADFKQAIRRVVYEASRDVTKIITGDGPGVDSCARHYALRHGPAAFEFEANLKYGKSADGIRDSRMCDHADALLVIQREWPIEERVKLLIKMAELREMPVYIEEVEL